ncbi:hypothetical protein [Spirochaeta isovalerica]|uniref:SH3 domain-containing protein n=1 Tax=Spirochaeta isovalerica TaxID=150 RepID=A0A841R6H5_9SPIO|nr:hypothetical protein [Spirochaeta isovalerica]MBB6478991.1 hypothetical protein [Spirochaeta isovalerica]
MKRLIIALMALFIVSCSEETLKEDIAMPSTPMLTASSRWGVVSSSYIRITDENDRLNNIIATLRKGDILEVLSRESDRENGSSGYWYEVRAGEIHGVVPEGMIDLYDSREKAENASKQM